MRIRVAAAGLALTVLVVLVLVLALRGGDGGGRLERGGARSGFGLRGDLTADDGVVDGAVRAYRDAQGEAAPQDPDGTLTLLWAGRTGTDRVSVVLSDGRRVVELTREGGGAWQGPQVGVATDGPGPQAQVVSFFDAVLLPRDAGTSFRGTDPAGGPVSIDDGLLVAPGGLPDGFVIGGRRGGRPLLVAITRQSVARTVGDDVLTAAQDRTLGPLLLAAMTQGGRGLEDPRNDPQPSPPTLEVRYAGPAIGVGTVLVAHQTTLAGEATVLATDLPGGQPADTVVVGGRRSGLQSRDPDAATGVSAAWLGATGDETLVVAGSPDVTSVQALVGGRRFAAEGRVLTVVRGQLDLPPGARLPDVVAFGRDREGAVVAADPPPPRPLG